MHVFEEIDTLVISQVCKFYFFITTSRFQCLSSLFLRDYRLIAFFTFLRYSYREGAIWFACSSLSIRLSSMELIGYILVFKGSVFSSAYIQGLRCFSYSSIQVCNKIFIATQLPRSYLYLIRVSARFIAPSLYIIKKLN